MTPSPFPMPAQRVRRRWPQRAGALLAAIAACPLATAAQLPFQLDDNLVHVQAWVNGHPAQAVLDSGSSLVLIDRRFAASIGIDGTPLAEQALGGGNGSQALSQATLESLEFGPIRLTRTPAMLLDNRPLDASAGFPVEVLLGQDVFADHVVSIDYPARTLAIDPADSAPACASPVPFTLENGVPVVDASISAAGMPAQPVRLIVDLGTRHYAAMLGGTFPASRTGRALAAAGTPSQVGTGTGGAVAGVRAIASELRVGDRVLRDVAVALTDQVKAFSAGFADGSLGAPFWLDGGIRFDYPHRRLCFPASPPTRNAPAPAGSASASGLRR